MNTSFFDLLMIPIWVYILYYLRNLERTGCICSDDWRRKFISDHIYFMLLLLALQVFDFWNPYRLSSLWRVSHFAIDAFFVWVVYSYLAQLRRSYCECSKRLGREVLFVVNRLQIGVLIYLLLSLGGTYGSPQLGGYHP